MNKKNDWFYIDEAWNFPKPNKRYIVISIILFIFCAAMVAYIYQRPEQQTIYILPGQIVYNELSTITYRFNDGNIQPMHISELLDWAVEQNWSDTMRDEEREDD